MTDNNISFLGKNNKNNDKKNVSDKNINSDTIENISNKNTVLDAADKKNISGKTTTLSPLYPFQMHSKQPDDRYLSPERYAWIPGYEA